MCNSIDENNILSCEAVTVTFYVSFNLSRDIRHAALNETEFSRPPTYLFTELIL